MQTCGIEMKTGETEEGANTDRDAELECEGGGGEGRRVASTFPLIERNWSQVTISWSEYV